MDLYPAQQTVRHIAKLCEGKERKKKKRAVLKATQYMKVAEWSFIF